MLKPFDRERLVDAVRRVKRRLARAGTADPQRDTRTLLRLLGDVTSPDRHSRDVRTRREANDTAPRFPHEGSAFMVGDAEVEAPVRIAVAHFDQKRIRTGPQIDGDPVLLFPRCACAVEHVHELGPEENSRVVVAAQPKLHRERAFARVAGLELERPGQ